MSHDLVVSLLRAARTPEQRRVAIVAYNPAFAAWQGQFSLEARLARFRTLRATAAKLPEDIQRDRAIYSAACQHIVNVASFTGTLDRLSDPMMHRKTIELLRDWAVLLAEQMDATLAHAQA